MKKRLLLFTALVGLVFLASPSRAQVKYSQRGFFLVDYKVTRVNAKFDRDFSKNSSADFGNVRSRFWNDFSLGEFASATWMFESDIEFGKIGNGSNTASASPFDPRGDRVALENGELFLDVRIPFTDFHFRGGQLPFFNIFPVLQDRTPGFHVFRPTGWIKPNFFYEPLEKTFKGIIPGFQGGDDYALGAWVDVLPMKGVSVRPLYFYRRINKHAFTDPNDKAKTQIKKENLWWLGLDSSYTSPNWYGGFLQVFNWGNRDFATESAVRTDQNHFAFENQSNVGYRWGPNDLSFNFLYRGGNQPRRASFIRGTVDTALPSGVTVPGGTITGTTRPALRGKSENFERIVTFFANKVPVSQQLTTQFQHPANDFEISDHGGPQNQTDAGWISYNLWYKRQITRPLQANLGFSVIQTARETDNDGDLKGDSRHVGEAFDVIFRYIPTRGLSFNTGWSWLITGDALDRPKTTGGSKDARSVVFTYFISSIWAF